MSGGDQSPDNDQSGELAFGKALIPTTAFWFKPYPTILLIRFVTDMICWLHSCGYPVKQTARGCYTPLSAAGNVGARCPKGSRMGSGRFSPKCHSVPYGSLLHGLVSMGVGGLMG